MLCQDVAIDRRFAAFLACSLLLSKVYLPFNPLVMVTINFTEMD